MNLITSVINDVKSRFRGTTDWLPTGYVCPSGYYAWKGGCYQDYQDGSYREYATPTVTGSKVDLFNPCPSGQYQVGLTDVCVKCDTGYSYDWGSNKCYRDIPIIKQRYLAPILATCSTRNSFAQSDYGYDNQLVPSLKNTKLYEPMLVPPSACFPPSLVSTDIDARKYCYDNGEFTKGYAVNSTPCKNKEGTELGYINAQDWDINCDGCGAVNFMGCLSTGRRGICNRSGYMAESSTLNDPTAQTSNGAQQCAIDGMLGSGAKRVFKADNGKYVTCDPTFSASGYSDKWLNAAYNFCKIGNNIADESIGNGICKAFLNSGSSGAMDLRQKYCVGSNLETPFCASATCAPVDINLNPCATAISNYCKGELLDPTTPAGKNSQCTKLCSLSNPQICDNNVIDYCNGSNLERDFCKAKVNSNPLAYKLNIQNYCTGDKLNTDTCKQYCFNTPGVECDANIKTWCNSIGADKILADNKNGDIEYGGLCNCSMGDTFFNNYKDSLYKKSGVLLPATFLPECMYNNCAISQYKPVSMKNSNCPTQCFQNIEFDNDGTITGQVTLNQESAGCASTYQPKCDPATEYWDETLNVPACMPQCVYKDNIVWNDTCNDNNEISGTRELDTTRTPSIYQSTCPPSLAFKPCPPTVDITSPITPSTGSPTIDIVSPIDTPGTTTTDTQTKTTIVDPVTGLPTTTTIPTKTTTDTSTGTSVVTTIPKVPGGVVTVITGTTTTRTTPDTQVPTDVKGTVPDDLKPKPDSSSAMVSGLVLTGIFILITVGIVKTMSRKK